MSVTALEMAPVEMVPVSLIDVDGKNLRREKGDVSGLKASLASLGMLQPLTLRPVAGGRYELVAGHRRFAAALQSGAKTVPAVVREMDERQKWEARLGENLHRKDLSPSEEGQMYQHLLILGYTQRELAEMAGRSTSHVCERLKLLEWPAELVRRVDRGEITITAAKRIVNPAPAAISGARGGTKSRDGLDAVHKESRVLSSFTLEELARFLTAIADDDWAQAATRTQARRLLRAVTQALNVQSCGRAR
jgi:ParB family chromosome partitioning protein